MDSVKKNHFTLIEIVIALGIVVLSLGIILPLVMLGMQSTKESISDNYVADASEQFLHYISVKAKNDWSNYIGNSDNSGYITVTKAGESEQAMPDWSLISDTHIYSTSNSSIYGIKQGSENFTDFAGVIRIWKAPVTSQLYSGTGWIEQKDSNYEHSAGLHIEISFRAEMPYKARNKRYFYLEIFRPN